MGAFGTVPTIYLALTWLCIRARNIQMMCRCKRIALRTDVYDQGFVYFPEMFGTFLSSVADMLLAKGDALLLAISVNHNRR